MRRYTPFIYAWLVAAFLVCSGMLILSGPASAQRRTRRSTPRRQTTTLRPAYEQGYLAGYSDGYNSGKSDYNSRADRDFQRADLYQQADRGYQSRYGALADYQQDYRLGYETAYTDGYDGRTFNSTPPQNGLALRGSVNPAHNSGTYNSTANRNQDSSTYGGRRQAGYTTNVPDGTELMLRLTTPLSTKTNSQGDRFTATVVQPNTYEGATVEGHIAKIERSGKLTGQTEMALDFDSITLRGGRSAPLHGQIEKVNVNQSVKAVDAEGDIQSSSKTRDTEIRGAGGGALGAIIGAVAGGGKGAIIGAILGGGVGAGSVYVQGSKDLILDSGTEMTIRTSAPQRERSRP